MSASHSLFARVQENFDTQRVMLLLGARLEAVELGRVVIELPYRDDLTQQDGFFHAGVITTVVDSACGYAAWTLMPEGHRVLSVEFKVNLMAPAIGDRLWAMGTVRRAGRTLTVCNGVAEVPDGDKRKEVALMQATMIGLPS